ncbi:MAG: DUF4388 domain-containing protein, partial [Gemmatimonadetes bacterium]|nr:DUF4388 domain-containing protein [Gemmatimonadota bacterium]
MELNGNTGVLPLFDVVQMLSVNDASGMLRVENADEKGYLYFQEGTVINALDGDHREGEEAAKRVFALAEADFQFSPELPSVAHTIRCSTQSLMMEIARQLDEESLVEGGDASHGERVREAQAASELLNDIFQKLDEDSRILSLRSHQGISITSLLEGLATETAVLHAREGAPVEIVDGGQSRPLGDIALDGRGFEEIRDLLLRSARPLSAGIPGAPGALAAPATDDAAFLLSVGTLGHFRVERHVWGGQETVTVHRLPDGDQLRAGLPWPGDRLDGFLAGPGSVVLLTASTADALALAFARACAHFLSRDISPFLGFARRWARLAPRAGRVLASTLDPSATTPIDL